MEVQPAYHSTTEILHRFKAVDAAHSAITANRLRSIEQNGDSLFAVEQRLGNALEHTVERLPNQPTVAEANRALDSLARNVDHGARLHATLTHALGIQRPREDFINPLPALPAPNHDMLLSRSVRTQREAAVIDRTHQSINEAIEAFHAGVAAEPLHIDQDPQHNLQFLAQLRARQDVFDTLDRARSHIGPMRAELQEHEEQLPDLTNTDFDPEQLHVLRTVSKIFVTDLVRRSQEAIRSARSPEEREALLNNFVDTAMRETAPDKDPLRFATSWTTDEHVQQAHSFIGELPSFEHDDLRYLQSRGDIVDNMTLHLLQKRAYPVALQNAEIDDAMHATWFNRIAWHPLTRVGMSAAAVAIHFNPQLYPIRAVRPMIASKKYLPTVLTLHVFAKKLTGALVRRVSPPPDASQLPERVLLDALRARDV